MSEITINYNGTCIKIVDAREQADEWAEELDNIANALRVMPLESLAAVEKLQEQLQTKQRVIENKNNEIYKLGNELKKARADLEIEKLIKGAEEWQ